VASPRGQNSPRGQKSSRSASYPGRALAGLLVLLIIMVVAITGSDTFSPGKWHHDFKVALGLDLAGGTQVTLSARTINGKPPSAGDMTTAISIMNSRVDAQGFNNAQVQQQGSNFITVTVPGKNAQQVVNLVGTTAKLFFRQVLLEGTGTAKASSSTSASTPSPSSSPSSTPSSGASSSPSPSAAGAPGSAGQPGGQRLSTASRLLAASKHKSGKPKSSSSATPSSSSSPSPTPSTSTPPAASQAQGDASLVSPAVLTLFNKLNCNSKNWKAQIHYTTAIYDNPNNQIVSCSSGIKYALDKSKVFGTDVTSAQAGLPSSQTSLSSNAWQVNLSLNGTGAAAFGTLTSDMYSKYGSTGTASSPLDLLAVVLDGEVVSAPAIDQGAITGGQAQITGSFTQTEATTLANQLQYGSLPINLTKQDVQSVSASLGRNQLVAGLVAAAIGLGLVVIYSFLYYRGLGLVSVSSLIIASVLAYLSIVLLSKYASSGFNLSLAGIAGLIVAIGITADSFVVFFERLRDEVRDGRSLRPAVESGWRRARRTILVSDTVSFLAALLLWYFSVSDVKGFAFTLGLTTLIDIIVVFLFTKPMVTLLARTRFFSSGHPLSGLDPKRLGARAPWRSGVQRTPVRSRVREV
jgi:preprotein translocase subunit SecD